MFLHLRFLSQVDFLVLAFLVEPTGEFKRAIYQEMASLTSVLGDEGSPTKTHFQLLTLPKFIELCGTLTELNCVDDVI